MVQTKNNKLAFAKKEKQKNLYTFEYTLLNFEDKLRIIRTHHQFKNFASEKHLIYKRCVFI